MKGIIIRFVLIFIISGNYCFSQEKPGTLKFIAEYIIENDKTFKGTVIGGLSGIERFSDDSYYMISDDYGEHGAPRMYKTKIVYDAKGIKEVTFLDVKFLGAPPKKKFVSSFSAYFDDSALYCDAEAIRYDKTQNEFIWSSEGYNTNGVCAQPFIYYADTNAHFVSQFKADTIFSFDCDHKRGLQHNSVFEALAFVPKSNLLVYCSEKSLLQDIRSPQDSVNHIRITLADKVSGKTVSQFAYRLNNVFGNNSNGITEILALLPTTFLVLERAYDKQKGNMVKLYQYTTNKATDVKHFSQLRGGHYISVQKELVLDFSTIGIKYVDNIEGMTWGHTINGHPTLLFVSDNNFNPPQITQLILFEYNNGSAK